jgi:hypothetical protein
MNDVSNVMPTRHKVLKINLSGQFYGTFAEIGAGQEVARQFFQAGGASGSMAKTISAYDMIISDNIYGKETSGRYVCESRLVKMLDKEYDLLVERLTETRGKTHRFFCFADTVAALNFKKTNEAHGWLGIRFQHEPGSEYNEIIVHVKLLDGQNVLQQAALGIFGVNIVYGAFFLSDSPEEFIQSLVDNVEKDRFEINCIKMTGPKFKNVDNRLLNLELVKEGFTSAIMFNKMGEVVLASENLYKKDMLVVRGSYRPPTHVSMDMIKTGMKDFCSSFNLNSKDVMNISEITITTLQEDGAITNSDFLARVDLMCAVGQNVLITNFPQYYKLASYLSKHSKAKIGLVLGVFNFQQIFTDEYSNLQAGVMESLAMLFRENISVYVYPSKENAQSPLITLNNLEVGERNKLLYEYLLGSKQLNQIECFDEKILHIYSRKVLKMIAAGEKGWEDFLPDSVSKTIKEKKLFGLK